MIQTSLKFNTVNSDRLFYDRWQYSIHFTLDEVNVLREGLDRDTIDRVLDQRQKWREQVRQRWPHNNYIRGADAISEQTREDLYALADFLTLSPDDYKMVVSVNRCCIYTNSLYLLERVDRLPFIKTKKLCRVKINRPRDTVAIKNPAHCYRSYFRSMKLNTEEKDRILSFLHSQKEVRLSPALMQWIDQPFVRTQDYFFVDYSYEIWPTMLSLIRPGLIRKTVQIVAK